MAAILTHLGQLKKRRQSLQSIKILVSVILLSMGFLQGCRTPTTTPHQITPNTLSTPATQKRLEHLKNFEAQGKVGYSDGQRGGNANIRWQQTGSDYRIHLYGPLGSGSIQIAGVSGSVSLIRSNGQTLTAKSPEALVRTELGWSIPVSGLRYWLRGMPAPGTPPKMVYDSKKELQTLVQHGWTVHYQSYQDINGLRLPYKLMLENGAFRLKFIFQKWQF